MTMRVDQEQRDQDGDEMHSKSLLDVSHFDFGGMMEDGGFDPQPYDDKSGFNDVSGIIANENEVVKSFTSHARV